MNSGEKTKSLHASYSIKHNKGNGLVKSTILNNIDSDEVENVKSSHYFQYALTKSLLKSTILSYPLTSRPTLYWSKSGNTT